MAMGPRNVRGKKVAGPAAEPVVSQQPVFKEYAYAGQEGGARLPPRPKGALWYWMWIGLPAGVILLGGGGVVGWVIWRGHR